MYVEYSAKELEEKIAQEAASFAAWCEDNLKIGFEDYLKNGDRVTDERSWGLCGNCANYVRHSCAKATGYTVPQGYGWCLYYERHVHPRQKPIEWKYRCFMWPIGG